MKYNLTADLINALELYEGIMKLVASETATDWTIIAGVMWRESLFGLALKPRGPAGTGDHGHGRGLMQVDDRWHPWVNESEEWKDPEANIRYAVTRVLSPAIRMFHDVKTGLAAYNAGPGAVSKALKRGADPDSVTTGKDYGADVLDRATAVQEWANESAE
jgi:soluble lytic murein transglycosylase-like protein